MLSKQELIQELSRLEERIEWIKSQLAPQRKARKRLASLAGKFPQLSTLTEAEIDGATCLWGREFERGRRQN